MTNNQVNELKSAERKANETIEEMKVVRIHTVEAGDQKFTAEVQMCGETTLKQDGSKLATYSTEEEFINAINDPAIITNTEEV